MTRPLPPHLEMAHRAWHAHLKPGDSAIDATCGNGRDLAVIVDLVAPRANIEIGPKRPFVTAYDVQDIALSRAQRHTEEVLTLEQQGCIHWVENCHTSMGAIEKARPIALIAYNLGYLPGGDKGLTTRAETTLISLQKGAGILSPRGAISVLCYPGHDEGVVEWQAVRRWASQLPRKKWSVCEHTWLNRPLSPVWIWLVRDDE